MISVIIPTLNEEKFLPHLLDSLALQTNKDFEVIVADGSSKDKTVEVANSYTSKLPKLTVVVSKKASIPVQRNLGTKAAKGDWFAFIDADGVLFPHFMARVSEFIAANHPKIVTTWTSPDSDKPGDANIALLANLIFEMSIITHRPFSPGPLTIVSRKVFEQVGGYDETRKFNEDVDFSMRVYKEKIALSIIPETLYVWSLRRLRKQGTLNVLQQYLISALPILLFKQPIRYMPGYIMGGQLYAKKKQKESRTKQYGRKLRSIMKELFG